MLTGKEPFEHLFPLSEEKTSIDALWERAEHKKLNIEKDIFPSLLFSEQIQKTTCILQKSYLTVMERCLQVDIHKRIAADKLHEAMVGLQAFPCTCAEMNEQEFCRSPT